MSKRYHIHLRNKSEIDDGLLTLGGEEISRLRPNLNRKNSFIALTLVTILFLIFMGRLYNLNIIHGKYYAERSLSNKTREYALPAPRGKIYDRSGKILAQNIPSTNIVSIASYLPLDEKRLENLVQEISSLFALPKEEISQSFKNMRKNRQPQVIIKQNASHEEVLRFLEKQDDFPGIFLQQSVRRQYEDSVIFSHLIGYEGKINVSELEQFPDYTLNDSIGRQGLERSYEKSLRGVSGARRLEVDAFGQVRKEISEREPIVGNDLILSIHADLQKKAFDTLSEELERSKLKSGAIIALNPRNGEVLALVSFPSFDNNIFAEGIDQKAYDQITKNPDQPLFNRAISGAYPPGSTIKPIVAVAALEENIISEQKQIESRGGIQVGKFFFGDWKAHGFTDIRRAIAVSSDVFFYSIGGGYGDVPGLGIERMKKYNQLFGLGEKTGIDLPGEVPGFLPDEKWKQEKYGEPWYLGNTYHASIGQGFITATPLQMASAISAIANGGTLYEPKIVSQIRTLSGEQRTLPTITRRKDIASRHSLEIVREGMRKTVTEGTAQQLNNLPVEVAGKTGTAQFGSEEKTHGWFESFAPYTNPEIVLVVMIEGQFKEDTYNAVPITHEILKWYFENKLSQKKSP